MAFLIRQIMSVFRRPKVKFGSLMAGGARGRNSAVRSAQFVGFLDSSGFRPLSHPARHEKTMHRRRFVVHVFVALLFLGFVWVMLESAHALALF